MYKRCTPSFSNYIVKCHRNGKLNIIQPFRCTSSSISWLIIIEYICIDLLRLTQNTCVPILTLGLVPKSPNNKSLSEPMMAELTGAYMRHLASMKIFARYPSFLINIIFLSTRVFCTFKYTAYHLLRYTKQVKIKKLMALHPNCLSSHDQNIPKCHL